ncbi:MAG TPA: hypothetical protein VFU50_20115 [Terriglobales bacterium]|nr:hypothetical protein [Terriglobales bacterium]
MRVPSYILSTALLAGLAVAQNAPASQTVSSSPQQPAKAAKTTAKVVGKNPFVPKTKATLAAAENADKTKKTTAKPVQAQSGNQHKASPSQTAAKPKNSSPVQAKAVQTKAVQAKAVQAKTEPKGVTPAVPKTQKPKKELAKQEPKPEPKKSEAKAAPVQAKAEAKPAEPETKPAPPAPAVVQNEPMKLPSPGKRDPFLNPLVAAGTRDSSCTTGKRCLVVDQIVLKGVVQMKEGNLALVENAGKHSYPLHENDVLYDGSVVKISGDSVTFREESKDILGRPVSREVVKKVTAPSVY